MRTLAQPLTVYYISPTGRETLWTRFTYLEGETLFDHNGAALTLVDAREIQAGKRPWLRLQGPLPTPREQE